MYQNLTRHRVGLYEKALPNDLNWEDKLKTTRELGFDFLEILHRLAGLLHGTSLCAGSLRPGRGR